MKKGRLAPAKYIAGSFAAVILLGALLLSLPACVSSDVRIPLIDALFTSTSAICVTGLATVDPLTTFTPLGQTILALLIQVGGLGVASIGVGIIMLSGKRINMQGRRLVKEGMNYPDFRGVLGFVRSLMLTTLIIELLGMLLSLIVFSRDYPLPKAFGLSAFHSISAFNNAGFDILPGDSLIPYQDNVLLCLTTCGLIITGGLGFFVLHDIWYNRHYRKLSLHTKVVLAATAGLLLGGTLLIKAMEHASWLGAFTTSTVARTAGFTVYNLGAFTNAGLLVVILLMFIGASPGSTGGGIKTTTFFVLLRTIPATLSGRRVQAFHRSLPQDIPQRALVVAVLGLLVVLTSTMLLCLVQPQHTFLQLLFEVVSAFATVGLSTGITPELSVIGKAVIILTMYIGRIGLLTMVSFWLLKTNTEVFYAEESVSIG